MQARVRSGAHRMHLKWLRLALGVGVGAVAAVLVANQVEWGLLLVALGQVTWAWLVPAWACLALAMAAKVYRWRTLLGPSGRFDLGMLARALLLGYLLNTVLPGRVGEITRAWVAARRSNTELGHVLSSIVVEKILDVLTLLAFGAALSVVVPLPDWLAWAGKVSGAATVLLCGVLVLAVLVRRRLHSFVDGISAGRSNVALRFALVTWNRGVSPFLDSVSRLGDARRILTAVIWSILVWIPAAGVNYSILRAFDIVPSLPAAIITLVSTNLGMAVPSAPGYAGVFHYLSVLSLQPFGVKTETALGYAVVAHFVVFGSFAIVGLIVAWRELGMVAGFSSGIGAPMDLQGGDALHRGLAGGAPASSS